MSVPEAATLVRRAPPPPLPQSARFSGALLSARIALKMAADRQFRVKDIYGTLNIAEGTLRNWKRDRSVPDGNQVVDLARILSCQPRDFYQWPAGDGTAQRLVMPDWPGDSPSET